MESITRDVLANCLELLLDAVFFVDAQGRIIYVSSACERIFGYAPSELIGSQMIEYVAKEDRERTLEEARIVMAGIPRVGFENRYVRKDGSYVPIMWSARWSESHGMRIGVARDMTARKHAEAIQTATYAISEAAHRTSDLPALFGEVHQILAKLIPVSAFALAIDHADAQGLELSYQRGDEDCVNVVDWERVYAFCVEVLRTSNPMTLPDEVRPPHGALETVEPRASGYCWHILPLVASKASIGVVLIRRAPGTVYTEDDNKLLGFVCAQTASAIERKQLSEELYRAARYDELTGLPNRRYFGDFMSSALARADRAQCRLALLFVDIDGFKKVNDNFGHSTGDGLLKEVARRLRHVVRRNDMVARLGGDEFVILLEGIGSREDVDVVVEKVRSAIASPMVLDGPSIHVRASIGRSMYPDDAQAYEDLLQSADRAMYADKRLRYPT